MSNFGEYTIRPYEPGDEHGILEGFNLVFGADNPRHVERTLEEWRWAFDRHPRGRRIMVALHNDRIVGQYAGIAYRTNLMGEERDFVHMVDSFMVHEYRARYKRPGLFVHTVLRFFEEFCGFDKAPIGYGVPVEKHFRLGHQFLGYEIVRTHGLLVREPSPGPTEIPEGVERLSRYDEQLRWLYDRCAGDWAVSAFRDAEALNWRFADHPRFEYVILGVRDDAGILRGTAVYRTADWILPRMGVLCEWLVPPGEPEVGEKLRLAVEALGRSEGTSALITLIPDWSPWFARFQESHWRVWPSHYFMGCRSWHPRLEQMWLKDHWWYQLSDVDLV
ncbi:MAG: GNAT family N-acetyltransferase [Planctomycetaceae bacterium]|nr:GNAT family N-acetyltransferase [Planctomycetaceae bacterium]